MIPPYFRKDRVAEKIGMSYTQLYRKLNYKCGQEFRGKDRKKLADFYRSVIQDLEDRVSVLRGSDS